jgi:hypothetical protein
VSRTILASISLHVGNGQGLRRSWNNGPLKLEATGPLFSEHASPRPLHDVKCNTVLLSKFFPLIFTGTHQVSWFKNQKVLLALKSKMRASRSLSLFEMPGDLLCIIGTLHLHCSETQNVLGSRSFVSEFWAIMQIWTWRNWALKVLDHYLGPLYSRSQCRNRKKTFQSAPS